MTRHEKIAIGGIIETRGLVLVRVPGARQGPGVAGATLVGASANLYRAQKMWGSDDPSEKHEAVVSAVFGALELAVAAYTGYKAFESRTETHSPAPLTPNASGDDDDGDDSDDE